MVVYDSSDEVLMAGLAAGDEEAARTLVYRFSPRAIGLAYQLLGDRSAAEDVAQEALLRAWRHASTFDARRGSASTWVLSIVRNLAIDTMRMRRAEPWDPATLPIARLAEPAAAADDLAQARDDSNRMLVALREVPVEQRRALVMAFAGLTSVEVAAAEHIPLGTAKTRIRTGLRRLRTAYLGDQAGASAESATPTGGQVAT